MTQPASPRSALLLRLLPALAAAVVPLTCLAGGSVAFGDIERLLDRTPQLKRVLQSFEPVSSAYAEVRLGPQFKHLGGKRLGPYTFEAHPKIDSDPVSRSAGAGIVYVTLCTTYRFVDRAGKVLPQGSDKEFDATQVREQVTAVVLRESEGSASVNCP
jgi:hypothetical protein